MKGYLALGVGLLAGTVIGAAAVTGLHAQAAVYLITEIDVTDPEAYAIEFVPKAQASIRAAGAKIVVLGGAGGGTAKPITAIEGTPPKRIGVQQWDSLDAAKAWYNSKDYQEALAIGKKYATFRQIRRRRPVSTAISLLRRSPRATSLFFDTAQRLHTP